MIEVNDLVLFRPRVVVEQLPGGEWNYRRLWPQTKPTGPVDTMPGWGSWVKFNNATLIDGDVVVRSPWEPSSSLSARAHSRALEANRRRQEVEQLYALSQRLMGEGDVIELSPAIPRYILESFVADSAALYLSNKQEVYQAGSEPLVVHVPPGEGDPPCSVRPPSSPGKVYDRDPQVGKPRILLKIVDRALGVRVDHPENRRSF